MSVGANDDTLKVVAEKLKHLTDETQEQYEAFIDATHLYKKGNVSQKDFLGRLADYIIGMTSLNFIAIEVLLEVKMAIQTDLSKRQSPVFKTQQEMVNVRTNEVVSDATQMASQANLGKSAKVKNCIVCGTAIPVRAKFCNKCGKSQ
jgi:ribosomal protein L40E